METNFADHVYYFASIRSTNTYIHENMDILPDKSIIIADQQFCGKGRYGREWVSSNPENAYISFFLKENLSLQSNISSLTQFTSIVVAQCLELYLPATQKCSIKWPNDVMFQNKKIAGVLAESKWTGECLKGVAVGIGVNLNMTRKEVASIDQPATSLNLIVRRSIDKYQYIKELVFRFLESYNTFLCTGMDFFQNELQQRLVQVPLEGTSSKGVRV
jgi:BirA family biotin operon repressor/biotin-[acetyl-CoA-carboxylase] ligase